MGDEASNRGSGEAPPRPPTLTDLARICAELNRVGARYVVVGGLAIIQAGYARTTEDIDLLVEATHDNEAKVIEALSTLPDGAARELIPGEIAKHNVVRIADEVLVDLMKSGCDVTYADAIKDARTVQIEGVPVPFASPLILWRMKQTVRDKDIADRLYLRELLRAQGVEVESTDTDLKHTKAPTWLRRLLKAWCK
jgi:hypothetical protein